MGKVYSRFKRKISFTSFDLSHPFIEPPRKTIVQPTQPQLSLFRLPQLAYKNVIDLLDFSEQVSLSLCSRRANFIIKNIRHRPQTLGVWIYSEALVGVTTGFNKTLNSTRKFQLLLGAKKMSSDTVASETVLIRGHRVPIKLYQTGLIETYWEDENFGLRVIGDYVCDLFRVDLYGIQIGKDHRRMFDWVNNRQRSVGWLYLQEDSAKINENDLKYIVSNCTTETLIFDEVMLENCAIGQFKKAPEVLALNNCNWFTMDSLMTVGAAEIEIGNHKLTNKDLNRFLKHWVYGGNPFLKVIRFYAVEVDEDRLLDGLRNHLIRGAEGERIFLAKSGHEYRFFNTGIQRNDGTTASLFIGEKVMYLGVWPDEMGRTFDSFV